MQYTLKDAKRLCGQRGFESLMDWAHSNRRAAGYFRSAFYRKGMPSRTRSRGEELARALDNEYQQIILPHIKEEQAK